MASRWRRSWGCRRAQQIGSRVRPGPAPAGASPLLTCAFRCSAVRRNLGQGWRRRGRAFQAARRRHPPLNPSRVLDHDCRFAHLIIWGVPAISPPRKLRWVLDAGCWVGALDPAPRSALRSCQPGAARCRWRLDSSLIQHPATQPSSLSTQRIQPLGAWVEAGSSRRAQGWVMYMGTGSSLGEAGWQASGFGRNAS